MQGASPDKAEIKDIRTTDDGGTKPAGAQAGQVPTQKFKELIKKWAKVNSYDFNIPKVGVPFSESQLQYWADEMDAMSKVRLSLGERGTTQIDLGKFEILGTPYTPTEYWKLLGKIDNAELTMQINKAIDSKEINDSNFKGAMAKLNRLASESE